MSRRGNHDGMLTQDKARGDWRAAVTLSDGSRRFIRGKSKADVLKRLQELHGHAAAGTAPPSSTMTVKDVASHWFDVVLPTRGRAPATVEQYRWAVDIITEGLGRIRLAKLSTERVEAFLASLAAEGYSRNSIRIVRTTLVQILTEAERRGHVARNVARLAHPPADATAPAERDALTEHEARRLMSALADDRLGAYWVLALTTGARRGELLGLMWGDVDLKEGTMTVRQALRRAKNGGYELGPTKTAGSMRTVRLSPSAVRTLKTHQREQKAEKLASSRWTDTGLVFTTTVGTHLDPNTVRYSWDRLTNAAGIEGRVPHELRHTAGSQAVDAGLPLTEVADQLGHSNVNMLARTYRHRTRPVVEGVAGVMEAFITPKRGRNTR